MTGRYGMTTTTALRTDWTRAEISALFDLPFTELLFRAAEVHRAHHAADEVQLCTLCSIKTGGCPEDCGYCSQSASAESDVKAEKLMDVDAVLAAAAEAKAAGSQRFCMGAAWRSPRSATWTRSSPWSRGEGHGAGDLHDAGHARCAPGAAAGRCGSRLLQPQYRHVAGKLRQRHHDALLRGPAGDAVQRA